VTIGDVFDAGEDVGLIWHERVRMPGSDRTLERDLPTIWTVRDGGTLHRLRAFKTREEALEAVGLEG
jgi:hypothetical protein